MIAYNARKWKSELSKAGGHSKEHYESDLNAESELKKLGYQISGTTRDERWYILTTKAIPRLGKERVVKIISTNINLRKNQKNGQVKYKHSLTEWAHDLQRINARYR